MTDEELNAIRERCGAATPGPWEWQDGSHDVDERCYLLSPCKSASCPHQNLGRIGMRPDGLYVADCADGSRWVMVAESAEEIEQSGEAGDHRPSNDDAAFIAAARTDVPVLLAEVNRLRAELRDYKAAADTEARLADEFNTEAEKLSDQLAQASREANVIVLGLLGWLTEELPGIVEKLARQLATESGTDGDTAEGS